MMQLASDIKHRSYEEILIPSGAVSDSHHTAVVQSSTMQAKEIAKSLHVACKITNGAELQPGTSWTWHLTA
jgi:hypothetical protein